MFVVGFGVAAVGYLIGELITKLTREPTLRLLRAASAT